MSFTDQVRRAIQRSGITRYRLSVESGVDQAALSRFMNGTGVTTLTLDALAEVLRMKVEAKGPRVELLRRAGR